MSTRPRRVVPGTTTFVTRRCSERRFFLRPSPVVNEIFLYVLAVAAKRYNVAVHGYCVLSNHAHLMVTDRDGRLPAFMQYLSSLVARAVNASLGRFEAFWATDGSYAAVEPIDPSDVLAKIAYILANPVAAGLVDRGVDWPGLWTAPEQIGTTRLVAKRPSKFFSPKGNMPETAELELTVPPRFASAERFRADLTAAVGKLEEAARKELAEEKQRILGRKKVLTQSPFAKPKPGEPRFGLKPRIAAKNRWRREEAIGQLKSWQTEYRSARDAWCAGARDVLFPFGTYLMRVMHGAQCAAAA